MSAGAEAGDALPRAVERAAAFVSEHGDALARTRLAILLGVEPPSSIETALASWQSTEGGFSPLSRAPSTGSQRGAVGPTLAALDLLDEAELRSGALLEAAVAWLARTQAPDGAWHPELEERVDSGDADAVFVTGMLTGHLSKLVCGSPRSLAHAEKFLAAHWSPERVEDGGWRGLAAYAHACTNGCADLADEVLQWCGRALEKGYRSGGLDALDVARVLLLCDVQSLPGGRVDAGDVVLALLVAQQPDGGFGEPGLAKAARVDATLVAVRAWLRFGPRRPAAASARAR